MEALNKIVESCPEIIKLDTSNKNLLSRADISSFLSDEATKLKKNQNSSNQVDYCDNSSNENLNQNFVIVAEKEMNKVCCTVDRVLDHCSIF
jgi:hypothetical protein